MRYDRTDANSEQISQNAWRIFRCVQQKSIVLFNASVKTDDSLKYEYINVSMNRKLSNRCDSNVVES